MQQCSIFSLDKWQQCCYIAGVSEIERKQEPPAQEKPIGLELPVDFFENDCYFQALYSLHLLLVDLGVTGNERE